MRPTTIPIFHNVVGRLQPQTENERRRIALLCAAFCAHNYAVTMSVLLAPRLRFDPHNHKITRGANFLTHALRVAVALRPSAQSETSGPGFLNTDELVSGDLRAALLRYTPAIRRYQTAFMNLLFFFVFFFILNFFGG